MSLSAWFYKYIVGLKIVSADEVVISPRIFGNINKVNAEFERNEKSLNISIAKSDATLMLSVVNDGFSGKIVFGATETELSSGEFLFKL